MTVRTPATRWVVEPESAHAALAAYGGIAPLVAALLSRRGIVPADAAAFLNDRTRALSDPFLLIGMDAAVARIREAYTQSEKICIYGDYDADGLTAQAVLPTA
jgi:single-stranded-DNA-specific exonuclease